MKDVRLLPRYITIAGYHLAEVCAPPHRLALLLLRSTKRGDDRQETYYASIRASVVLCIFGLTDEPTLPPTPSEGL